MTSPVMMMMAAGGQHDGNAGSMLPLQHSVGTHIMSGGGGRGTNGGGGGRSSPQPYVRIGNLRSAPGLGGYQSDNAAATNLYNNNNNTGLMGRTYNNSGSSGSVRVTSSFVPMNRGNNGNNSNVMGGGSGGGGGYGGWTANPPLRQQPMPHTYAHSTEQQQLQRDPCMESGRSQVAARGPSSSGAHMKAPMKDTDEDGRDTATLA